MSSGSQTRVAAFFDIDGTLVPPPSLEWRLFRRMIYRRAVPARNYWLWLREAIRLVPDGVFALHHNNKMCLRGTKSGVGARDFGPANNSSHLVAFFLAGVARVAWHASRGHAIVFVSGTLEPLAQHTALLLEAQLRARGCETTVRVCATRMEESGGTFTGRILGEAMVGAEKARAARRIAAAEGWDLARSFAYGDDASDRWLLETVRHPAAINPTARLARIASGRRWPMLEWKAESRILRLGSNGPFEQSTYGKQRTYAVSDVNCAIHAQITGTRRTHLLSGLVLLGALLLVAGVASAQEPHRTFRVPFHSINK